MLDHTAEIQDRGPQSVSRARPVCHDRSKSQDTPRQQQKPKPKENGTKIQKSQAGRTADAGGRSQSHCVHQVGRPVAHVVRWWYREATVGCALA